MAARSILACVSLFAFGFVSTASRTASADIPSFLYTVATQYEALAWVHGSERFPSGAKIFVSEESERHLLVAGFAASADPSVSFDGQHVLFAGKQSEHDAWQIWETSLSGGEPRRLTSCAEDCIRPFYLPDDRIVYAQKASGRFTIEALSLADSKAMSLTYGPGNFLPADVLLDGRVLFESSFPIGGNGNPELYTVYSDGSGVESYRCDHSRARHQAKQIRSGDIVFSANSALAKFTSSRARQIPITTPAGEYAGDVAESASGNWLLPWRASGKDFFQLMLWTPGTPQLRTVLKEQDAHVIEPTLIRERPAPNRHPSGLHDWPNANLLCLNAYTSQYQFAAESIHSVRVYTKSEDGTTNALGTARVERDGSFFVQVPNDRPVQIELLDSAGKTLKRESGFFWMRRGEQRVCVGCHAGPETAPENAVPMILLKSTTPADLTGASAPNTSGGH